MKKIIFKVLDFILQLPLGYTFTLNDLIKQTKYQKPQLFPSLRTLSELGILKRETQRYELNSFLINISEWDNSLTDMKNNVTQKIILTIQYSDIKDCV